MSRKIFRVHTHESVYVGPTEPHETFPPREVMQFPERAAEWSFDEAPNGDVVVTHRNPRAKSLQTWDAKAGAFVTVATPHGAVYVTRIPAANVRDVQYEFEAIPAPKAVKGAA